MVLECYISKLGVFLELCKENFSIAYFLVLTVGTHPSECGEKNRVESCSSNTVKLGKMDPRRQRLKAKPKNTKDKEWILRKKESRKNQGLNVARDSKYTGRKRKSRF